ATRIYACARYGPNAAVAAYLRRVQGPAWRAAFGADLRLHATPARLFARCAWPRTERKNPGDETSIGRRPANSPSAGPARPRKSGRIGDGRCGRPVAGGYHSSTDRVSFFARRAASKPGTRRRGLSAR